MLLLYNFFILDILCSLLSYATYEDKSKYKIRNLYKNKEYTVKGNYS